MCYNHKYPHLEWFVSPNHKYFDTPMIVWDERFIWNGGGPRLCFVVCILTYIIYDICWCEKTDDLYLQWMRICGWSQSGCIVWVISVQLDQAGLRSRAGLMQMQKTDVFKSVQIVFACNYKTGSLGAGGCWGLATQLWAFSGSSVCSVWDSQCECRFQLLVCIQSCCC